MNTQEAQVLAPMAHPLDGAFARVVRAEEHLAELSQAIARCTLLDSDRDAIAAVAEFDPKAMNKWDKLYVLMGVDVPHVFSILIGEICYNLRSALDYLIWELARLDSGGVKERTQFPIEDTPDGFMGRRQTFLNGINHSHVALIETLQPYKGCHWTQLLRDLSNPDKHRHLTPVRGQTSVVIRPPVEETHRSEVKQVNMQHGTISIRFRDSKAVIPTLEILKLHVRKTLEAFRPEF